MSDRTSDGTNDMANDMDEPREHAEDSVLDGSVQDDTVFREVPYDAPDHDLSVAAAGTDHPDERLEKESGFHPVHVAHLVMGIAFLAFAGIWAGLTAELVDGKDLRWLLPVPWLLAGTAGLVASVAGRGGRQERKRQRQQAYGA